MVSFNRGIAIAVGISPLFVPLSLVAYDSPSTAEQQVREALKDGVQAIRTEINKLTDKNTLELSFGTNIKDLNDDQKRTIEALIDAYKQEQEIHQVVVAAYSNKAYPKGEDEEHSADEVALAKDRAELVKGVLTELDVQDVVVYNMAEKSNWFQNLVGSKEAKVKKEAAVDDANMSEDDRFNKSLATFLVAKGKPGKVILVVRPQIAEKI